MLIRLPILSACTVAVLVWFRPAAVSLGHGETLALAVAWVVALLVALWLLVLSSCCALALRRGRVGQARRCATLVPKVLRRGLELAIVTSAVAASTIPAHAISDEPIVRTPQVSSTPTTTTTPTTERPAPPSTRPRPAPTTTPAPATTPAPTTPATTTPAPTTRSAPAPEREPAPIADVARPDVEARPSPPPRSQPAGRNYVVRPGDNLWVIAQRTLEHAQRPATELVAYWHAVIEANASTIRSGDPNLIYPGEVLTLPAVGGPALDVPHQALGE